MQEATFIKSGVLICVVYYAGKVGQTFFNQNYKNIGWNVVMQNNVCIRTKSYKSA